MYYRGKVGTGFDDSTIREILKVMKKVNPGKNTFPKGKVVDEKITTFLEPRVIAEVSFSRLTPDQIFREPVFIRLRPDMMESV